MRIQKIFFILLFSACSVVKKQETTSLSKPIIEKKTFFVPVSITKLSPIQTPCVDVNIDGNIISMELDLGFRGDITIVDNIAEKFKLKSFICEKQMHNFKGKPYLTNLYRIPKAKIGSMTFHNPFMQEESEKFVQETTFVQDGGPPSARDPGRLGWRLFYNSNLLVDTKYSALAFCDSFETLAKQGYAIDNFTKTPLFLDRGLVEIEADGPEGKMRYILDTGATWNVLNREIEGEKPIDEAVWEPENLMEYAHFKIGEQEFGPLTFHRLPIKLPFQIDGVLGMEFFEKNMVFLDFSNGYAYFSKYQADSL